MRTVYALIPAALLAGTVLSASADAKSRRVEQYEVHAHRVLAQSRVVKTNVAGMKMKRSAKVLSRKKSKLASAKARKLAAAKKIAAPAAMTVEPDLKLAGAKPRKLASLKKSKIARLAPAKKTTTMALVQKDIVPPKKRVSFASMSLTKTLPSAPPREPAKVAEKPLAVVPKRARKIEAGIKPNESNDNYVINIIREMAPSYGVPTWFALRIANVESGYNPYARGRAGEIGIYQLKCQTAKEMGFEGECMTLTDARTNVRWGLKHLSLAIASSGGDLKMAASKHNGGLGRKSLVHSYIAKVF
jgi:soluble lytic murein transglycosylase-like protein